jgi:hypothetical protein
MDHLEIRQLNGTCPYIYNHPIMDLKDRKRRPEGGWMGAVKFLAKYSAAVPKTSNMQIAEEIAS